MAKQRRGPKPLDATKPMMPPKKQFHSKELRAKTPGQQEYMDVIDGCQIVICNGPAGSGKSAIAIGMAARYLLAKKVEKIVITRPLVTAGEDFGALPGGIDDKIGPYIRPLIDELHKYFDYSGIAELKNSKKLEIVPLAYMRGLNFHNTFVVADECQNASLIQLKMLLSRIGHGSKMVITGDSEQTDLAHYERGGFDFCIKQLDDMDEIGVIELLESDIVRNPLISKILERLK